MLTLPLLHPYLSLLSRAIELSSSERIGVYGCLYVALAEREQCKVVSADQRLVNKFPTLIIPLSSL
ncbi:MAG TPA: type II toxin-antitoxin system VapC family toxin [Pirellulales bacterium]|nr:type II toxin-antitoxin system VapC family toxin [Pirellulales bacterium]